MASQEQPYNSEFKATVALKALGQNKQNLDQLSEEYKVPVSLILTWTVQLERNASHIYATTEAPEDVRLQAEKRNERVNVEVSNADIKHSFNHGVMHDDLDYKKLFFWAVMGILFFLIFVQIIVEIYQNGTQASNEQAANGKQFYQSQIQKREAEKRLSSYGVVNLDKGVYREPIDTAMDQIVAQADSTNSDSLKK